MPDTPTDELPPSPQRALIARLRAVCASDERVVAAMLYGSFTYGEADAWSDVDCLLYFAEEALPGLDQRAWLEQLAPVETYYHNEFGVGVAIFDSLVRGEFHFDPASQIGNLRRLRGTVSFPSQAATVLVDRTGKLAESLDALIGPPPERDRPDTVSDLANGLCNWVLFGINVLRRGEYARALEVLNVVHDQVLRLARLSEGPTGHWITPTRALERELPPEAYERYRACTAALEPAALWRAYRAAWAWGVELLGPLAARHGVTLPLKLMEKIGRRIGNKELGIGN